MSSFSWRVPLCDIDYDEAEEAAALRVLRSRWLTLGPEVEHFERAFLIQAIGQVSCKHWRHVLHNRNGY